VQLTAEERMAARARRALAPLASRERAAQLLGADAATLDAQLLQRAEAGSQTTTTTGLRLDQAAVLYRAFTDGRLATTVTGPAGSGKTHTLVAAGLAAKKAGTPQVWGVTCAQGARNVLADAAARAGLPVRAYNSAKLFDGLDARGAHQLRIASGSLIIIDEASMMPAGHLARIIGLADDLDCKVLVAGDQEQLAAVEGGGGMRLLARENGYVQLAEPVRFEHEWERPASLRLRDGLPAESRIWLDVPFAEKDEAAQAGAQWDYEAKRWYAPGAGIKALARWDPAATRRDPAAVLADVLRRDGAERSASEIRQQDRRNADHLAVLNAIWQGEIAGPRTDRYQQILREALPAEYSPSAGSSPQAAWLWRTLRSAEAAGLDARQVVEDAVHSRPLAGARDVASVVDARIREQVGSPIPGVQATWAEQIPEFADSETQAKFSQLAVAMDERTARLGRFTADQRPEWAIQALGEVPPDPRQRAEWERRASRVAAYREMYGYDHPADPIGPEPSCDSPEKRAAWHAGLQAVGSVDGPDVRGVPDGSLWLMRDTYEAETALAPKYVTDELRQVRLAAEDARLTSVRADAEAEIAGQRADDTLASLHRTHARSARALQAFYEHRLPELEQQDAQYREWEHVTEGPRRIAIAADAELRRRQPHLAMARLKSAEPDAVTEQEHEQLLSPSDEALARPAEPPEWVARLAAARDALQEKLDERKAVRVPADDHELQDEGEAWPTLRARERDAIVQPPPPEIPASPRVIERARERDAGREAGE